MRNSWKYGALLSLVVVGCGPESQETREAQALATRSQAVLAPAVKEARDIFWRNAAQDINEIWLSNRSGFPTMAKPYNVGELSWTVRASTDIDGNGTYDIIWTHNTLARISIWLQRGPLTQGYHVLLDGAPSPWQIVGAGDFNRDGKGDLLWRHPSTGSNVVWYLNGTARIGDANLPSEPDTGWSVAGTGYINGDDSIDILWHKPSTGDVKLWLMSGTSRLSEVQVGSVGATSTSWRPYGVGDYNGDGIGDLYWYNTSTGGLTHWLLTASGTVQANIAHAGRAPSTGFVPVAVGQYHLPVTLEAAINTTLNNSGSLRLNNETLLLAQGTGCSWNSRTVLLPMLAPSQGNNVFGFDFTSTCNNRSTRNTGDFGHMRFTRREPDERVQTYNVLEAQYEDCTNDTDFDDLVFTFRGLTGFNFSIENRSQWP